MEKGPGMNMSLSDPEKCEDAGSETEIDAMVPPATQIGDSDKRQLRSIEENANKNKFMY